MSTIAYAALTTKREEATPGTSSTTEAPGVRSYVDALAALVPSEVLTLHAVILSSTTAIQVDPSGRAVTTITAPQPLRWAFFGLIGLTVLFYAGKKFRSWDTLDYVRAAIPAAAFVAWTMLQRATAFDAVAPTMDSASRSVVALFLAVMLGFTASALAGKADQQTP